MNWPDERYVKLYVRDTANWQMLPWQSKALLPLLLRKFDGAGIMDTGKHDKTRAVALIVGIPAEVVGPGLDGLIADGVVQHIDGGLVCPNFIDSQEACKTEAQKKRDQRQRVKDQRMATQRVELTSTPVPFLSRAVPFLSPSSPAQPSPAQIKDLASENPKPRREKKKPHPEFGSTKAAMLERFAALRGEAFEWLHTRDQVALSELLKNHTPEQILGRWSSAIVATGWPRCDNVGQLRSKWSSVESVKQRAKVAHF